MNLNESPYRGFFSAPLVLDKESSARYLGTDLKAIPQAAAMTRTPSSAGVLAVVPIRGMLIARDDGWGWARSSEAIGNEIDGALADPQVSGILLDIDSPGGQAAGVEEVAQKVLAARSVKPVVAHVNHLAASGAYWIASAASSIVATPSAYVGSIGVWTAHQDVSKLMERMGVKVTLIKAGKFKIEGNPYEPLSEEAMAAIQADVEAIHQSFLSGVAKGRGVTVSKVKSEFGEGRTVRAADAKGVGMIDSIGDRFLAVQAMGRIGREMKRGPSALDGARARVMAW